MRAVTLATLAATSVTLLGKPQGNFEYWLVRSANDLPPTDYHGNGALHCDASRPDQLFVWSMGRES